MYTGNCNSKSEIENIMKSVEIESSLTDLGASPFKPQEFPYAFLATHEKNTLTKLVIGNANVILRANLSLFTGDCIARQKLEGSNFKFYILKQLAICWHATFFQVKGFSLVAFGASTELILPRVRDLFFTADGIASFVAKLGFNMALFIWHEERRFWRCAERDAAQVQRYGRACIDEDDSIETFPIVKRMDIASHGSYRTKEANLSIYDEMARCRAC